jgi:aldo/keto reductase family protein
MMSERTKLGGAFTLPGTSLSLNLMGYGAMQLAGPQVGGPPRDVSAAFAVLREAIATGVNHIDTSDYYGPHVTNQIIKQALHPYPDDLVIALFIGDRRLNLQTLFKFIPARFAKTLQYIHASVADHCLDLFRTFVGLAIRLCYHLHDVDCRLDDRPRGNYTHSTYEGVQVYQTSCFELVMNQSVAIDPGTAIDKCIVEFLSFGFAAGTSLRLHLDAQGGPRSCERCKPA